MVAIAHAIGNAKIPVRTWLASAKVHPEKAGQKVDRKENYRDNRQPVDLLALTLRNRLERSLRL
jgi:hypothetical protein